KQTYWPLITSTPSLPMQESHYNKHSIINICLLGRVIDFKVIPLLSVLPSLVNLRARVKFHIIGSGQYEESLRSMLLINEFSFEFHGTIPKGELDKQLMSYDLVMGIGTSILESAKLGIPSIVMNGSYKHLTPEEVKFDWLHNCPPY